MPIERFAPHGACWLWDWRILVLHAPADLVTFLAYAVIPLVALWIYRTGHVAGLAMAYPRLWRRGALFVAFCGLSHLGSFVEVYMGGWTYVVNGGVKTIMAVVSVGFAWEFWRVRAELATLAQIVDAVGGAVKGER